MGAGGAIFRALIRVCAITLSSIMTARDFRRCCVFVALSVSGCLPSHATPLPSCTVNGVRQDQYLAYAAILRSDHPAPLDSLAIAFHSSRPGDDSLLRVGGWRVPQPTPGGSVLRFGRDSLRPAEPRTAMKVLRIPGAKPGPWACPDAVQVVRTVRGPGW